MKPRPIFQDQDLLFRSRLSEQLNPKHELLRLAKAIDWNQLEMEFVPLFSTGAGHPPIPIRFRRSIERIVRAAKAAGIQLKRTYARVASWALKDYLRLMHGRKMRKAESNAKTTIKRILVDRGFRGHEVSDAEVLVSYTRGLPKGLKIALRRRQAIEPWIGHMKHDGKLGRCYLKGVVGDQIHATLVAAAHNFRTILRKLRSFCVEIFGWVQVV